jgi:hypothetical protein
MKLLPVPPDPIVGRCSKPPPPPKIVGCKERYKIEEVINSWTLKGRLQYLVRWKGYGHKENSWISEDDIDACELIAEFYSHHPNASRCISALTFRSIGFQPQYQTQEPKTQVHQGNMP